jgi:transcriptional regulator with XRE-family HTH domain
MTCVTLSRLETGRAGNPTVATLMRVAGSLGKVVNCVLGDAQKCLSTAMQSRMGKT